MLYTIPHRYSGAILFSLETESLKLCVEAAVKSGADLRGADLRGANLRGADLRDADLGDADLGGANLRGADLRDADLGDADLGGANLRGTYLRGADLRGTYLRGADLRGAVNADLAFAMTSILPEGDIIGYKKLDDGSIAKLLIPATARRSNAAGRKCRAEYVDVLEGEGRSPNYGNVDPRLIVDYRPGLRIYAQAIVNDVLVNAWDDNRWNECSTGVHFYITRVEAE